MKRILSLMLFVLANVGVVSAQGSAALHQKHFNLDKSGLAIEGYDPVAYFTQQKAVEGLSSITLADEGIIYRFGTAQNRELFKANPEKYKPQYGGWCAYAMGATAEKVSIDPATFKLIDGKLYLFYNRFFTNTKNTWNKDEKNLKAKADANWLKTIQ